LRSEPTARTISIAIHSTAMLINFFSFPTEIRNKIYEEALVLSEPIVLVVTEPNGSLKGLSLPSKYAGGKKLPEKNMEEGRIMNGRQSICK
jgi:hypothetical protein